MFYPPYWIGLYANYSSALQSTNVEVRRQAGWMWLDGTPYDYQYGLGWLNNHPLDHEQYGVLDEGQWCARRYHTIIRLGYICETSKSKAYSFLTNCNKQWSVGL